MTIQEAAKVFEDQRKRCRLLYIIYGVGMLAAIAMMFLQEMKSALLIFVLLLVVYFVIVRSSLRQYTAKWREFCVRMFTEKHFGTVSYSYGAKLDDVPVYTAHTLMPPPVKGHPLARNVAKGSRDGMNGTFLDSTVSNGESSHMRFYSGCWMGFEFKSHIDTPLCAVRGEFLPGNAYERWLTESRDFRPCIAPDGMPKEAFFYSGSGQLELSRDEMDALKALLESMVDIGTVEINPEGLFVFLPHRLINKLPPSLKYPVTEKMISQVTFPEIDRAYALAQAVAKADGQTALQEAGK